MRRRADIDGLKEFGHPATEEIATCFCPENMVSKLPNVSGFLDKVNVASQGVSGAGVLKNGGVVAVSRNLQVNLLR